MPRSIALNALGNEVLLLGRVVSLPEIKTQGKKVSLSFVLDISAEHNKGEGLVQVSLINPGKTPETGDLVWVLGKLDKPKNRFGQVFDYSLYLYSQGIETVLYGFGKKSLRISLKGNPSLIDKIRMRIGKTISLFSSGRSEIIFKALILGTRGSVEPKLKEMFFKTGTSHLLAISGLNIALVAGSFYLCLIIFLVNRRYAAIAAIFFTVFQVLISGSGYPVLRSGWMAGASFLAIALERPKHSLNLFFLALLLVLLADTRAVYSVSFQLSFLSVFSMIVCSRWWEQRRFKDIWAVPLAVSIGTFPVVVYHFGGFSLISIAANFFAIPLFHFTLLSLLSALLFSWIPLAGKLLFSVSIFFLSAALGWIRFCAGIPGSYVYFQHPDIRLISIYYFIFFGVVWIKNLGAKRLRPLKGRLPQGVLRFLRRYSGKNAEAKLQSKEFHPV